MSDIRWNNSTDLGSANSYRDIDTGAAPPTIPVDDDNFYLDEASQQGPSTNVDVLAGIKLGIIHYQSKATYDVASSGQPLSTSADRLIIEGSGSFYYFDAGGSATETDLVEVRSNNLTDAAELGGDIVTVRVLKGGVKIMSTLSKCNLLEIGAVNSASNDARVKTDGPQGNDGTEIGEVRQFAGHFISNNPINRMEQLGGLSVLQFNSGGASTVVIRGGTMRYRDNLQDNPVFTVYGGLLDLRELREPLVLTTPPVIAGTGTVIAPSSLVTIVGNGGLPRIYDSGRYQTV